MVQRDILAIAAELQEQIGRHRHVVVAFSGGVDSSVVAAAAHSTYKSVGFPSSTTAVTARSPSVAQWQQELAVRVASEIGIRHQFISTDEWKRSDYIRNDGQRCFHCKQTLYGAIDAIADHCDATILSGTNFDDLGDHRPGIQAGHQANVHTPLADLKIGKATVRRLADHYGLSNAEVPASPCLASRIAYGVPVTPDRLLKIERAEGLVRSQGFTDVRVRCLQDEVASVEVPADELQTLREFDRVEGLDGRLRSLGFSAGVIDPQGLVSGKLNRDLFKIDLSKS